MKIQVSDALKGFIITNDYKSEEAGEYTFMNIEDVNIKPGTSPSSNFEKIDNATATKNDVAYGISVLNDREIFNVEIKYSYFGIPLKEIVEFN